MARDCLHISCVFNDVARACEFAHAAALRAGAGEEAAYACYLAVDEACTNIIEHGRLSHLARTMCIEICAVVEPGNLILTIEDDGEPFDPLSQPEPDAHAVLEERRTGGWGIYFIKRLMDDVGYHYVQGRNQLKLIKRFN